MTDVILPAEIEDCLPTSPRPRARAKLLPEPSILNPPPNRPRKLVGEKRRAFLKHLALTGRWQESSAVAGTYRETAKTLQRDDPLFAAQCAAAERAFHESLEAEIMRRGHEGYDEVTTTEKEAPEGTSTTRSVVHRFSDKLLLAHAQAKHPAFQRQPDQNVTQVNVAVSNVINLDSLPEEALKHLEALIDVGASASVPAEPGDEPE